MTTVALEAKLKFLNNSAHFYSTSDPATSAHLMLHHNMVASIDSKYRKTRDQERSNSHCTACGTMRFPGWTSRISIINPDKPTRNSSKREKKPRADEGLSRMIGKQVVVECLTCRRKVTTPLLKSRIRGRGQQMKTPPADTYSMRVPTSTAADNLTSKSPQDQAASGANTANGNSKKRAKSRKQGGLQAMLEKSKEQGNPSSGFGLDLMDLMKKS